MECFRILLLVSVAALVSTVARADEFAIKLKPGAGKDVVQTQCAACHSLDYIVTNSPYPTEKVWDAEVTKMIKAFGAPISPEEAKTAVGYLTKAYGH